MILYYMYILLYIINQYIFIKLLIFRFDILNNKNQKIKNIKLLDE